jgi:diguanylate cyclase (GGDEF)-like protein/PAS domain S-box-containing protein
MERIDRTGLRTSVIVWAAACFALITAVRFAAGAELGNGIALLYVIPICLLATRYDARGGIAGAMVAEALLVTWVLVLDVRLPSAGYFAGMGAYVVVGATVGRLSARRRDASDERDHWFEMSGDMVCEASLDGFLTRVNDAWTTRLGYTRAELMGRPYAELIHPDDVESTRAAASNFVAGPFEIVNFENRYRTKDGEWRWLLWSARTYGQRIYARATDITELKLLAAEREQLLALSQAMALTDELTALPNRRAWDGELQRELARATRSGHPLSLAMIDVDDFKRFNDDRGHLAGDAALRRTAAAWVESLRQVDFLARYGGEEFSVLLPGCSSGEALQVIDRLRAATPDGLTSSAGLASWDGSESAEALVARADAALYEAKRTGRDRSFLAEGRRTVAAS